MTSLNVGSILIKLRYGFSWNSLLVDLEKMVLDKPFRQMEFTQLGELFRQLELGSSITFIERGSPKC